jgi:hypothetical protein
MRCNTSLGLNLMPTSLERPITGLGFTTPRSADGGESAGEPIIPAAPWRVEVLRFSCVGSDDRSFHPGGCSFPARRSVNRVRGGVGLETPLKAMFDAPTAVGSTYRSTTD